MFVSIVEFAAVVDGRDLEAREWFEWSNGVDAAFDGFVSRRLLQDTAEPGRYAVIVEHASGVRWPERVAANDELIGDASDAGPATERVWSPR